MSDLVEDMKAIERILAGLPEKNIRWLLAWTMAVQKRDYEREQIHKN